MNLSGTKHDMKKQCSSKSALFMSAYPIDTKPFHRTAVPNVSFSLISASK